MSGKKKAKAQRQQAAQRSAYLATKRTATQYWHGGAPGLSVGDELLSRDDAERALTAPTAHGLQSGYALGVTRTDRVYFSSDREFARAYASKFHRIDRKTGVVFERGTLYRVEPIGSVEDDPDFAGRNVSWCAPRARVVAIEATEVFQEPAVANERIGPHMTWDDGSPLYSADGDYLPSPILRARGLTAGDFYGQYPAWFPFDLVDADLAGRQGGDRPDPAVHPAVGWPAASTATAYRSYMTRARVFVDQGCVFRPYRLSDLPALNDLLAEAGYPGLQLDDDAGSIVLAEHPQHGLMGAIVFTAMITQERGFVFVDAIATAEQHRHNGVGSVLLNTAAQLLPVPLEFIGGHCSPDVAPFFSQAGFTVLRQGVDLAVPVPGKPNIFKGADDQVWFYRQSVI
jgi:GNAT superfamily N-acetyltransferase